MAGTKDWDILIRGGLVVDGSGARPEMSPSPAGASLPAEPALIQSAPAK